RRRGGVAAAVRGGSKMAAALWVLLSALAGLAPGPGPAGAAQLPLLVWSTERSLWSPPSLPGGRALSEPELQQLLEPGLRRGPRTVLLFLQDQVPKNIPKNSSPALHRAALPAGPGVLKN
uniref:V-type proton ATPase subunit S1-like n=1 Tax=Serinus canaria TaxID=9135 RepID=A0A8C9KWY3_SERCA